MKNIYLKVIQKLIFLAGLVFIACEAPDQPTYDEDHPDPNPTGKQAPILNLITPQEGYLNQIVTIEGSGFDTVPEYNFVVFDKKVSEVISASETLLEVKAPNIADATVDVKVAVKGSEFWSNILPFTFKSVLAIITEDINWPMGVEVDDQGNVYIGSAADSVIYKYDLDGNKTVFAEVPVSGAIGWGPGGYLYVAQSWENKIVRVSSDGLIVEDYLTDIDTPVDFDWDSNGNMYICANDAGFKMYDGTTITHLADIGGGAKSCRVYGNAIYLTNIWEGQIIKFSIADGEVSPAEVVYQGDAPVGLEIDVEGTIYFTEAWETTLYTLAPDGSIGTICEDQLMTPMRYLTFHDKMIYIVHPGWGDVGKVISVYVGVDQAPNYGL